MAKTPQGVLYEDIPHFVNADGQHIFARGWAPPDQIKIRSLCLIIHGATEHSGRYGRLAVPLTGCGIMVYSHDHVGHGQSEGDRADIKDFNIYIRDTLQHVDIITEKYPNLPIFLFGHSMGGAISILTAMERPKQFAGIVVTGPAIKLDDSLTAPKEKNINPASVSRDPKEVEAFVNDPLVYHGVLKPDFASALGGACKKIQDNLSSIQYPFLILHGDADTLCDVEGSKMMAEKAQSTDKHLKVHPGYYHALLSEPEAADVIRDIIAWIVPRITEPTKPDDVHFRD